MAIKAFRSAAAALALSTTAALAPGFTAQAEAQASNPAIVYASAEHARDIEIQARGFAMDNSHDAIVLVVIQPEGGDARAMDALETIVERNRAQGITIGLVRLEAEGQVGTDIHAYAGGSALFRYENYDHRDINGQSGIMREHFAEGWDYLNQRRTASLAEDAQPVSQAG